MSQAIESPEIGGRVKAILTQDTALVRQFPKNRQFAKTGNYF